MNPIEKYNVFLYAADYYSAQKHEFKKSYSAYEKANKYLKENWKYVIDVANKLANLLEDSEWMKLSKAFPDKFDEFLMEESVHFNYFASSLQEAYTDLEKINKKLEEVSVTDYLTGLNNRRYFWSNSSQLLLLAQRDKKPVSIVIFDIDDFKKVNDVFGHAVGDEAIKAVSSTILNNFRKTDMKIRFGGEEFLVLLYDAAAENAKIICEFILQTVSKKRIEASPLKKISITLSAGISL